MMIKSAISRASKLPFHLVTIKSGAYFSQFFSSLLFLVFFLLECSRRHSGPHTSRDGGGAAQVEPVIRQMRPKQLSALSSFPPKTAALLFPCDLAFLQQCSAADFQLIISSAPWLVHSFFE